MNGPCRLVFFGIIAVGRGRGRGNEQIKVLLPLQHVKANFNRIRSTLTELKTLATDWISCSDDYVDINCDSASVELSVSEAVNLFKRQAQKLLQATGHWSQLEIVFITSHTSTISVMNSLCSAVKGTDAQVIKKIQLICVVNSLERSSSKVLSNDETPPPVEEFGDKDIDPMNVVGDDNMCSGLIESYTMSLDQLSLHNLFMSWLHDSNTDQEHLRIYFTESGLNIKCDLMERMLNTASFSFYESYNLSTMKQSKVIACSSGVVKSLTNTNQVTHSALATHSYQLVI